MVKRAKPRVRAAKAEIPGFIKPQLATLEMKAPSEGYFHEIKYDGYRAQVHVDKGYRNPIHQLSDPIIRADLSEVQGARAVILLPSST